MLGRLHDARFEVQTITYPDDELDIGPSSPKGLITLFTCRRPNLTQMYIKAISSVRQAKEDRKKLVEQQRAKP
jgi:hypothetical protein